MMNASDGIPAQERPFTTTTTTTTESTGKHCDLNFLTRREDIHLEHFDYARETLLLTSRLSNAFQSIIDRRESLARYLDIPLVSGIVEEKVRALFTCSEPRMVVGSEDRSGVDNGTGTGSETTPLSWVDVVREIDIDQLRRNANGNGGYRCRIRGSVIEIFEADRTLILSGIPQKLVDPWPDARDAKKEADTVARVVTEVSEWNQYVCQVVELNNRLLQSLRERSDMLHEYIMRESISERAPERTPAPARSATHVAPVPPADTSNLRRNPGYTNDNNLNMDIDSPPATKNNEQNAERGHDGMVSQFSSTSNLFPQTNNDNDNTIRTRHGVNGSTRNRLPSPRKRKLRSQRNSADQLRESEESNSSSSEDKGEGGISFVYPRNVPYIKRSRGLRWSSHETACLLDWTNDRQNLSKSQIEQEYQRDFGVSRSYKSIYARKRKLQFLRSRNDNAEQSLASKVDTLTWHQPFQDNNNSNDDNNNNNDEDEDVNVNVDALSTDERNPTTARPIVGNGDGNNKVIGKSNWEFWEEKSLIDWLKTHQNMTKPEVERHYQRDFGKTRTVKSLKQKRNRMIIDAKRREAEAEAEVGVGVETEEPQETKLNPAEEKGKASMTSRRSRLRSFTHFKSSPRESPLPSPCVVLAGSSNGNRKGFRE